GVLRQVEILVGWRRDDDAQRLRQDDEAQRQSSPQPERGGGLALTARDGEQAGAHDFRDEGGGIGRQRDEKRDKFREQPDAADEIKAAQLGRYEADRPTRRDKRNERRHDQERQATPDQRYLPSGAGLQAPRPKSQRNRRRHARGKYGDDQPRAFARNRRGHDDPAVIEENLTEQRDALARRRQRAQDGEIPEQNLEQERQVADQFDIACGEARKQPIW